MNNSECISFLQSLDKLFDFNTDDIKQMVSDFHLEMDNGLRGRTSSLKMLPAFVDTATGNEKGKYIALDVGGTNFRVLQVSLVGGGKSRIEHVNKFAIPHAAMHGTGEHLFDFIAQSIKKFIVGNEMSLDEKINLGFTFSFPMNQTGIASGVLINWTKEFSATGVVGENVVKLLAEAFERNGLKNIDIDALANDTVGTLAAKSYEDSASDVGIIFGTGTNACYRERVANIRKLDDPSYKKEHMIVNMEWGNFDRLRTNEYDQKLDKATNNPSKQTMEKMISGMYLGELVRLMVSDMIGKNYLFVKSKVKLSKGDFKTEHMSIIESDDSDQLIEVQKYLGSIGILDTSLSERELIKKACRIVSARAARISSAAISAVVTWMDPELKRHHTVAIDGSLYENYPGFRRSIRSTLRKIHGDKSENIVLTQTKDGSGLGVAIVAAVAACSIRN